MNKEEFINEFNDWTKEEILSRAFEICCENIELKEKLEKRKKLRKNDIKVWDDDLEYIKYLKLQRYELKEQIKNLELLLVESNKELWELKERIKGDKE